LCREFLNSIALLLVCGALAAAEMTPREVLTGLALGLTNDNASEFLALVDRSLEDYEGLERDLWAICGNADVQSSIDVLSESGEGDKRTLEADWFLEIKERGESSRLIRRREVVRLELTRGKKGWLVTALRPRTLFAAP
jgi:hypothetical protein